MPEPSPAGSPIDSMRFAFLTRASASWMAMRVSQVENRDRASN